MITQSERKEKKQTTWFYKPVLSGAFRACALVPSMPVLSRAFPVPALSSGCSQRVLLARRARGRGLPAPPQLLLDIQKVIGQLDGAHQGGHIKSTLICARGSFGRQCRVLAPIVQRQYPDLPGCSQILKKSK